MKNNFIKNDIILKVDKKNYKFTFNVGHKVNKALLRIFTGYKTVPEINSCTTPTQTFNVCDTNFERHLQQRNSGNKPPPDVDYIDYFATDVNMDIVFTFDKKILLLKPARYLATLIIDDKCCQEVILDTFNHCTDATLATSTYNSDYEDTQTCY